MQYYILLAPTTISDTILFQLTLADLGGHAWHTPPYGSRFFHFDIQNFHNIAASGVHAPPMRSMPPLWEIWICHWLIIAKLLSQKVCFGDLVRIHTWMDLVGTCSQYGGNHW